MCKIDTTLDFGEDTPAGLDPDRHSATLRRYHQCLWSKPLPSGKMFDLTDTYPTGYLHHHSELGDFRLSGDGIGQTLTRWKVLRRITEKLSDAEIDQFYYIACTIGARIVFPVGPPSINQVRGFQLKTIIADRFDLTLECIRRHYVHMDSPMSDTLGASANREFFDLFEDFRGYVRFFLLDDLIRDDLSVRFFTDFDGDGFPSPAIPPDDKTYNDYRLGSIAFFEARNRRIERYASECCPQVAR